MLGLVQNLDENLYGPHLHTDSSCFPLGYHGRDCCLARGQNHLSGHIGQEAFSGRVTTQEELESIVGTLITTHMDVWKAPLHLRYLQRLIPFSLKQGRKEGASISLTL